MNFSQLFQKRSRVNTETLAFSVLPGGFPQGKIIEMRGPQGGGKTETLLSLFQENLAFEIVWIEVGAMIYPRAFSERGVNLSRVLFVDASDAAEALWCAHQVLKSQIFKILVLSQMDSRVQPQVPPHTTNSRSPHMRFFPNASKKTGGYQQLSEIELRRLQIAAGKSGTTVFFLNENPITAESWPIEIQLEVTRDTENQPAIRVLKSRRDLWTAPLLIENIG